MYSRCMICTDAGCSVLFSFYVLTALMLVAGKMVQVFM